MKLSDAVPGMLLRDKAGFLWERFEGEALCHNGDGPFRLMAYEFETGDTQYGPFRLNPFVTSALSVDYGEGGDRTVIQRWRRDGDRLVMIDQQTHPDSTLTFTVEKSHGPTTGTVSIPHPAADSSHADERRQHRFNGRWEMPTVEGVSCIGCNDTGVIPLLADGGRRVGTDLCDKCNRPDVVATFNAVWGDREIAREERDHATQLLQAARESIKSLHEIVDGLQASNVKYVHQRDEAQRLLAEARRSPSGLMQHELDVLQAEVNKLWATLQPHLGATADKNLSLSESLADVLGRWTKVHSDLVDTHTKHYLWADRIRRRFGIEFGHYAPTPSAYHEKSGLSKQERDRLTQRRKQRKAALRRWEEERAPLPEWLASLMKMVK